MLPLWPSARGLNRRPQTFPFCSVDPRTPQVDLASDKVSSVKLNATESSIDTSAALTQVQVASKALSVYAKAQIGIEKCKKKTPRDVLKHDDIAEGRGRVSECHLRRWTEDP